MLSRNLVCPKYIHGLLKQRNMYLVKIIVNKSAVYFGKLIVK